MSLAVEDVFECVTVKIHLKKEEKKKYHCKLCV